MKNKDFFIILNKEKNNEKKSLFRDTARIIGTEFREYGKNLGAVFFSGIAANFLNPFFSFPLSVNLVIGGTMTGIVTHAHVRHAKNRIGMRIREFKNNRSEIERLRYCLGVKMATDAEDAISFSSNEKSLSMRLFEIVKNREDISVRIKKNGAASFTTLAAPSEKLQPV